MDINRIAVNAGYFYKDSLIGSIKELASVGFRKIEFPGLSLKTLTASQFKKLKFIMKVEGLTCTSVNAVEDLVPVNLGNLAAIQEKERGHAIDYVKQCIDFAVRLGSKRVVCDLGTSTEDFLLLDKQNEIFLFAIAEVLAYAKGSNVRVVLMNIPGRRWVASGRLLPDMCKVAERHVWPWRAWPDEEEMLKIFGSRLKNKISWAFDTANEIVASGITEFDLKDILLLYIKYGLEIIYLANHPGPYNKVWHRSLLHQPLWSGFYDKRDYRLGLKLLEEKQFQGEVVLQIREKEPSAESLKQCLEILLER